MTETTDRISSLKKGETTAKLSTIAVALLAVLKGFIGFLSGSIALLADAVHSLSDVLASLAVWLGLRLAQKKPTEKFPYGYYKAETLASLAVAVVILASGIEILWESIKKFSSPSTISFPFLALSVAIFSMMFSYLLSRYKGKTGREINSRALIGESKHSMVDVYLSLAVFSGILFSHFGVLWVEPLAGLIIGIAIVRLSVGLARDTVLVLMDACLRPDRIDQIKTIAKGVSGVKGVHDVKIRRSGPFVFGEMHVEVEEEMAVERAHAISDEIERKIKDDIGEIDSLTIHVEPAEIEAYRVAVPIDNDAGLESTINPHLGKAPHFLFIDIDNRKVEKWFASQNPGVGLEKKRGITSAQFLIEHKVNVLLVKELGEGPFHLLKDNLVKIYRISDNTDLRQTLDAFQRKELESMTPTG
jgi:cation diffusion facilitator family transporter